MLFEQTLFVFEVFVDTNKKGLVIKMVKTQLLDPHEFILIEELLGQLQRVNRLIQ